jgi:membrane protein
MAIKPFSRLVKILTGVYAGAESELSRLERFAHLCALVTRTFVNNRCPIRAAALSYTTLLALIPLLAVAVSVTSGLLKNEGEEKIYGAIDRMVSTFVPPATNSESEMNPDVESGLNPAALTNSPSLAASDTRVGAAQKEAAHYIHAFIQNTRSVTLGAISMLLLVYVAIQMLASIESTFNDIWGVTRGRNWLWRIVLYWTTITLGPLLIVGAVGLAGGSHFQTTKNLITQTPFIGGFIFQLLPLLVLWLAFTLIYLLVPNTKVRLGAALIGGIVGGTLWHLNNVFGFLYVSRVVSNSEIYGTLGLVPVFMIGLYFSWLILLLGAQVAYAYQNRKEYLQNKLAENVNQRGREFIALRLMTCIAQRFQRGLPPVTIPEISAELGIPTKLAHQVLRPLLVNHIVTEIAGVEPAFAPARSLETINAHHVLRALRAADGQDAPLNEPAGRSEVYGEFARIEEAERAAASSVNMLALVSRPQKQIEDLPPKAFSKRSARRRNFTNP